VNIYQYDLSSFESDNTQNHDKEVILMRPLVVNLVAVIYLSADWTVVIRLSTDWMVAIRLSVGRVLGI
jgi:hypothetical protein